MVYLHVLRVRIGLRVRKRIWMLVRIRKIYVGIVVVILWVRNDKRFVSFDSFYSSTHIRTRTHIYTRNQTRTRIQSFFWGPTATPSNDTATASACATPPPPVVDGADVAVGAACLCLCCCYWRLRRPRLRLTLTLRLSSSRFNSQNDFPAISVWICVPRDDDGGFNWNENTSGTLRVLKNFGGGFSKIIRQLSIQQSCPYSSLRSSVASSV